MTVHIGALMHILRAHNETENPTVLPPTNGNVCSHYYIVDDVNGFHRVFFVTRDGNVRKSQMPYTRRKDAEEHGKFWTGKPLPRMAQPA